MAHNLTECYLTNRKQSIEIYGVKSDIITVNTGVPQGSILSPIPFIIYVNNITKTSDLFKFIIYTDNTIISSTMHTVISETNKGHIEAITK